MILELLKMRTAGFHNFVEQQNFSSCLMTGNISREQYGILLTRLYCFFHQASSLTECYPDKTLFSDQMFGEQAELLKQDLYLMDITEIPMRAVFEKLDFYEAAGFCYVVLGSTLGAKMIYKSIFKMQEDRCIKFPTAFYENCKVFASERWIRFISQLQLLSPQYENFIINGARIAYLYFIFLCTEIK